MTANGVERQRRGLGTRLGDGAARDKAQLDERLEAVADTQDEAAALIEQCVDASGERWVTQEGRHELRGAVRFVTAGETARQVQHLRAVQGGCHALDGLGNVFRRAVAHNEDFWLDTGALQRLRGVVFGVGAREDRNECARGSAARDVSGRSSSRRGGRGGIGKLSGARLRCLGRVDGLEGGAVGGLGVSGGDGLAAEGEAVCGGLA